MANLELRISVLLSLQAALLGHITANIRGITCSWNASKITIHSYFHGEISDDDIELMECVATEVIADFLKHKISIKCKILDFPEPLNPHTLSAWVYRRSE